MPNRRVGFSFCLLLVATLSLLLSGVMAAQEPTGNVIGTVTDPQGSVLPGAQVTVTNTGTQQKSTVTTGQDGSFRITNLPIGNYTVTTEHSGFAKTQTTAQKLQINQSLRFDIKLQLGGTQTTVEVAANASQVETVGSTLGQSVTSRPLVDLPLNGRNVLQLALLQPGVTETNEDNTSAGNFSIAGGRTDSVTYLLDGGINNNLLSNGVVYSPNPDTVAEFRILQNNYTAEYGRNGGGVVSVVTKSGTNNFHGTAFEFLRNDAFNANTYFNNLNGVPRDVLKRNQYGGTIGGPIVKDKLFFFFGYQGQKQSATVAPVGAETVQTFTPAQLNGDFSGDPGVVQFLQANPAYIAPGHTAADAVINPAMFNPTAKAYIAAGLIPTSPTGELFPRAKDKDNREEFTAKADLNITTDDKIAITLGRNSIDQLNNFELATVPGYPDSNKNINYFANIAYIRTFTAKLLNEFRFTAQRNNVQQEIPVGKLPTPADLGTTITADDPTGPPLISFDTGLNLGYSYQGPTTEINNTFSYADNLTWSKGKHTWKFGGGFTPYQNNTVYDFIVNGWYDFYGAGGVGTGSYDPNFENGNAFADFLIGAPYDYYQYPAAPSNIRSKNTYVFAQDEWHLGRRLVLNLGLRYEYSTPKSDTQGRSQSLVPGIQSTVFTNAPLGLVFPGDRGAPRGANFPDKNDFAPRFGFAWDPWGDGKMSVRGGFGMFYDILKGEDNLQFNGQPPFFASVGIAQFPNVGSGNTSINYFNDPFGSSGTINPFPSHAPPQNLDFAAAGYLPINGGQSLYLVDPNLRTPYTYQYNLNVQHELSRGTVMELAYVGSTSHKLTALVDANPMDLATVDMSAGTGTRVLNENPALAACNAAVDYCFANIPEFRNVVNQQYNALEASATRQPMDTGWFGRTYFTMAYTWSHNIDNASGFRQRNSQVPAYNPGALRASSDLDVRHRITLSGGWDLGLDRWWSGGPKRLTQTWSLFPIFTWRTGFPIDVAARFADRFDPAAAGPSGAGDPLLAYANVAGPTNTGLTFGPGAVNWFNSASFTNSCEYVDPANGCPIGYGSPYGTVGRNSLRGPSRTNLDLALAKVTKLTENTSLQFRAEAFNILNHAQFSNPDTNINHDTFGQILNTADPRILQFALRFQF